MARARLLKPGFFANDKLGELPPVARLLFQGLWCIADREGRLEDRPKRIKAEVLPYDRGDPDRLLDLLADAGFIERYGVAGSNYIQISAFTKHQHPHPNEPGSALPPPDSGASAHADVTTPSDIGGSTQAVTIAESIAVAESLTVDPPVVPPQAGGHSPAAQRGLNGSRRKRDVEAANSEATLEERYLGRRR